MRTLSRRRDVAYDVAIVGLGISGLAALSEFVSLQRDLRILLIEREKFWQPASIGAAGDQTTYRSDNGSSIEFNDDRSGRSYSLPQWWTSSRAGGGFNRWYGQVSRFKPEDFDGSFGRPWPFQYADIAPWYDRVERDLLPYGCSYGHSPEEYRQLDCHFLRDRVWSTQFERLAVDSLASIGMEAYVGQTCLGGRVWEETPSDPESLTPTRSHPMLVRPNYYVPLMRVVADDPRFEVWDQCALAAVSYGVGFDPIELHLVRQHEPRRVRVTCLLLAGGPLSTVSLLLRSGLQQSAPTLGQGLTFTLERVAYALLDVGRIESPLEELIGRFSSIVVKSFYTYATTDGKAKGGKFALYDARCIESDRRRAQQLARTSADAAAFMRAEAAGQLSVKLSYKGESDVSASKYLSLSAGNPVIHYQATPGDMQRHGDVERQIAAIFNAIGAQAVFLQPIPLGPEAVSAHHHGGAVALGGSSGVVSAHCEILAWPGVFVVDASFMPTSGGTNSSLTVMANARRVACHILDRLEEAT